MVRARGHLDEVLEMCKGGSKLGACVCTVRALHVHLCFQSACMSALVQKSTCSSYAHAPVHTYTCTLNQPAYR